MVLEVMDEILITGDDTVISFLLDKLQLRFQVGHIIREKTFL